jgi:tetratricopeptide (TPR) repeat protein
MQKTYATIIFLFAIAVAFSGCSSKEDICRRYLDEKYSLINAEHEQLYKEGNISEAISLVKEEIKRDSNNYVAIGYLSSYQYVLCQHAGCSAEELKEVYELIKKALVLCDDYPLGYFNIIQVLSDMSATKYKNDPKLLEYLEMYNSRYPKNSKVMSAGGIALYRLGRIEEAHQYLNEAISLDLKETIAYIYKAKCYIEQNELENAMKYLNLGLSSDSISLGFHDRGFLHKNLGNTEAAIRDFQTAIYIDKNRFESYILLGQIEAERKNFTAACQYFEEAKAIRPDDNPADLLIGTYCRQKGD